MFLFHSFFSDNLRMPVKKKVKFDKNNEYKHYTKESESQLSDSEESKQKAGHSLDSDEEDNTEHYKSLNRQVLAGKYLLIYHY